MTERTDARGARGTLQCSMAYFVVNRFEGTTAVIIADDGREFTAPRRVLPEGSDEGTILRLNLDHPITGDWSAAQIDNDERRRRGA